MGTWMDGLRLEDHGQVISLPSLCTLVPLPSSHSPGKTKPCPLHAVAHTAGEKHETALNAPLDVTDRHAAIMPWVTTSLFLNPPDVLHCSRSCFLFSMENRREGPAHLSPAFPPVPGDGRPCSLLRPNTSVAHGVWSSPAHATALVTHDKKTKPSLPVTPSSRQTRRAVSPSSKARGPQLLRSRPRHPLRAGSRAPFPARPPSSLLLYCPRAASGPAGWSWRLEGAKFTGDRETGAGGGGGLDAGVGTDSGVGGARGRMSRGGVCGRGSVSDRVTCLVPATCPGSRLSPPTLLPALRLTWVDWTPGPGFRREASDSGTYSLGRLLGGCLRLALPPTQGELDLLAGGAPHHAPSLSVPAAASSRSAVPGWAGNSSVAPSSWGLCCHWWTTVSRPPASPVHSLL